MVLLSLFFWERNMTGKNFGQTVRELEREKMPALWKIIVGGVIGAALFYLMTAGLFSLDAPVPIIMIR